MRTKLVITDVHYGHEDPQDLAFDILQVLLHHLKLDLTKCYNKEAAHSNEPGQTTTSRKRRG